MTLPGLRSRIPPPDAHGLGATRPTARRSPQQNTGEYRLPNTGARRSSDGCCSRRRSGHGRTLFYCRLYLACFMVDAVCVAMLTRPVNASSEDHTYRRSLRYGVVQFIIQQSVRPLVHPSVRKSVPSVHPSVRSSVRPCARPTVRPSVRPYVRPTVRPSVRPSTRLPSAHPFARPSVRPSIRPSVRQSVRPSIRPSIDWLTGVGSRMD